MTVQPPLPLADWAPTEPTIAMTRGDQAAWQCGWCGTVVIVASGSDDPARGRRPLVGKACPGCDQVDHGWWRQDIAPGGTIAGWTRIEAS